jgi:hypothetical protein
MKRREFIAGLAAVATGPLAARAQQPKLPVVAFITAGSLESNPSRYGRLSRRPR